MKLSELTPEFVVGYLRAENCEESLREAEIILSASKAYIKSSTGLTDEECELHEDLTIAALCLCGDMYDNRQTTVSNANQNRTVDTILNMYRVNFL